MDVGSIQDQLKELRIELIDHINECQDFDDEPEAFDAAALAALQIQSERICTQCIQVFEELRSKLAETNLNSSVKNGEAGGDRAQLPSMRSPTSRKPVPSRTQDRPAALSPPTTSSIPVESSGSGKTRDSWSIDSGRLGRVLG